MECTICCTSLACCCRVRFFYQRVHASLREAAGCAFCQPGAAGREVGAGIAALGWAGIEHRMGEQGSERQGMRQPGVLPGGQACILRLLDSGLQACR